MTGRKGYLILLCRFIFGMPDMNLPRNSGGAEVSGNFLYREIILLSEESFDLHSGHSARWLLIFRQSGESIFSSRFSQINLAAVLQSTAFILTGFMILYIPVTAPVKKRVRGEAVI